MKQHRGQEPMYHNVMTMESTNHSSSMPVAATRGVSLAKELKYLAQERRLATRLPTASHSVVGTHLVLLHILTCRLVRRLIVSCQ